MRFRYNDYLVTVLPRFVLSETQTESSVAPTAAFVSFENEELTKQNLRTGDEDWIVEWAPPLENIFWENVNIVRTKKNTIWNISKYMIRILAPIFDQQL